MTTDQERGTSRKSEAQHAAVFEVACSLTGGVYALNSTMNRRHSTALHGTLHPTSRPVGGPGSCAQCSGRGLFVWWRPHHQHHRDRAGRIDDCRCTTHFAHGDALDRGGWYDFTCVAPAWPTDYFQLGERYCDHLDMGCKPRRQRSRMDCRRDRRVRVGGRAWRRSGWDMHR